jgi:phage anti-repressor protein
MSKGVKTHTIISSKFIDDFFSLYDHKTLDSDFVIDLDVLSKWLGGYKSNIKDTLLKSYTKDIDYIVSKSNEKTNGRPRENILLTPDCMKRLCMLSRTKKAEEVRTYFLDLEKLKIK